MTFDGTQTKNKTLGDNIAFYNLSSVYQKL
jgi:hypothetical protein